MGRLLDFHRDPHKPIQLLLPWYVTGRIDPADAALVEAHVGTCLECRAEVAIERQLRAALRDLPLPAEAPSAPPIWMPPQHRLGWLRQPVGRAWFIGAQAAVILLCIGLFALQDPPVSNYRVLGDAIPAVTGNLLVSFAPATSAQAMDKALRMAHARLVRGPTPTGAYLLLVAPDERLAALAVLRSTAAVTLAEPVDAPPS